MTTKVPKFHLSEMQEVDLAHRILKEWDGSEPPYDVMKVEFLRFAFQWQAHLLEDQYRFEENVNEN